MNFISEDFHLHNLTTYTLYIQSNFNNDLLVVVDVDNNVLAYQYYDNMNPSTEAVKLLSYSFGNVIVGLPHQNIIWVPAEVFDESEKSLYAPYFLDEQTDNILVRKIDEFDVYALFQFEPFLINRWNKIFPAIEYVPSFEILLKQSKGFTSEGNVLGVHSYDNQADLFLFVNGEFKLFNTFEIETADDLSYFVLSIMKNFSILGKFHKILLSGIELDSEWSSRLVNYTDEIVVLQPNNIWNIDNEEVRKALIPFNILADTKLCV